MQPTVDCSETWSLSLTQVSGIRWSGQWKPMKIEVLEVSCYTESM